MTSIVDATHADGGSAPPRPDVGDRHRASRSQLARTYHAVWGSWPRRIIVLAVVVGFALRVWWIVYAARLPAGLHDPFLYLQYSQSIAHGHGYRLADGSPTAYYPIGYPAILGAWYWVAQLSPLKDHWLANAMALNLVFSTATIALVGVLGRRLAGAWVGALTAVIAALFPSLVFHSATILTETTFNFVFLVALVVLCWHPWTRTVPSWGRLVAFGVLFGISVEVRPIALFVVPMVLIALWRVAGLAQALIRTGVVVITLVAVMAPWAVRNQVVMHAFLPIGTTTGDNLCIGNFPGGQGHFELPDFCFGDDAPGPRPEFETARNDRLTSRSLHWIVENPLAQLRLIPQRTYYTFRNDSDAVLAVQSYGDDPFIPGAAVMALSDLADAYFFGVVALALVGVPFMLRGRDRRRLFLLLCIVAVAIAPWPFFGDPRFHIPLNPLLPVPAALTLVVLARVWRGSRRAAGFGGPGPGE